MISGYLQRRLADYKKSSTPAPEDNENYPSGPESVRIPQVVDFAFMPPEMLLFDSASVQIGSEASHTGNSHDHPFQLRDRFSK
ncbi:MAG: hypothetical protein KDK27_03140 [Leptospiraceae bacterium]|nr:hypothetical protein [Leptospiraceae bacterium]